ncbi:hypothetical protein HNP46_001041 [Pseudomonas nitritireducens]|uniref:Lipoprotein n=1 Tax=Pseudomonas nitroreducens TaxID=46680 RepID=A0A7W7KHK1_PSENT|nr:hypothetical protein [Pseudomonas nitritireducens]MBB4862203.1 hypothetical protein [Pseudomonas nitritireducens]
MSTPLQRHRALAMLLPCLLLAACSQARPLQPPPPLFELWAKSGVDQQGVRSALLDCGFPDAAYVDSNSITSNDYARAEQCMLGKGFVYQDRYTLCDTSPQLAACKTAGSTPQSSSTQRPPAYTQWTQAGADSQSVQQAMQACGYTTVIEPIDDMLLNDIAAAQLCMLDRGFRFTRPANSLLCRNPPMLQACRGKVIDTQNCCAPPRAAGQH